MPLKVIYEKEIHIYKGNNTINELSEFVNISFGKVPKDFVLTYTDSDGD